MFSPLPRARPYAEGPQPWLELLCFYYCSYNSRLCVCLWSTAQHQPPLCYVGLPSTLPTIRGGNWSSDNTDCFLKFYASFSISSLVLAGPLFTSILQKCVHIHKKRWRLTLEFCGLMFLDRCQTTSFLAPAGALGGT